MQFSKPFLRSTLLASVAFLPAFTLTATAQEIDLLELTVADIQAAYAAGDYTAEQLTQAYLDRIATYNPAYNAFTAMNDAALDEAQAIDARRAAGEELGPLAGIPILVKEAIDMAGFPSTAGWAPMASQAGGIDFIPSRDAPVVHALREAGAIIIGRTNIPVFSSAGDTNNSWAGITYNAVDRSLSPGGSSAGSALGLAANFAVLALGEETRGSLQIPAAAQSVVAVKPTFGLVPNAGVTPIGGSATDVVGPMARTVTDAALMLDVMAGYDIEDPKTISTVGHLPKEGYTSQLSDKALEGVRIGIYGEGFDAEVMTEETAALFAAAVAELEAQGAVAVTDVFAGGEVAALPTSPNGMESGAYDWNQYYSRFGNGITGLADVLAKLDPEVTAEGQPGNRLTRDSAPFDFSDFIAVRETYLDTFAAIMEENDLDGFVFPVFANGVPPLGDRQQTITVPEINMSGLPGVVVPAGAYESGQPFALIFIGPMWSEAKLLAYAYDYEQATHHRIVPELTTEVLTTAAVE